MTALLWASRILFAVVWVVLAVGVYFGWSGALSLLAEPPAACVEPIHPSPWSVPPPIVWASLAAFGLGAFLGFVRENVHQHVAFQQQPDPTTRLVLVVLSAALVLTTALLGYETYATATGRWPITRFVHCAYLEATPQTIVEACAIVFLLGHWLWYVPGCRSA